MWWAEELIHGESSKITRPPDIIRTSPAQRRPAQAGIWGRSGQDALAFGACGRAQRTMGGERGLRRRRPVSGLSAAHIPPLFPRPAARVADAPPHQAFPPCRAAPEAARSPGGSGGRRGGSPDGGRAAARCAQGRPACSDKDGGPLSVSSLAGPDSRHHRPQMVTHLCIPRSHPSTPPYPSQSTSDHTQLPITSSC